MLGATASSSKVILTSKKLIGWSKVENTGSVNQIPISKFSKLRQLGLPNQIVDNSDFKPS